MRRQSWHGYPCADWSHPSRPWWVCIDPWYYGRPDEPPDPGIGRVVFRRTDGLHAVVSVEELRATGDEVTVYDIGDGAERLFALAEPHLAEHDREHPFEAPPPRCGQVWKATGDAPDGEWMITNVVAVSYIGCKPVGWSVHAGKLGPMDVGDCLGGVPWPPVDHVLVDGPGAPWASVEDG